MMCNCQAVTSAIGMLNDVSNVVVADDDPEPTSSYDNLLIILRERTLIAQDWKVSDAELKKRQDTLKASAESRLPSKHFLTTLSLPALTQLAQAFAEGCDTSERLEAAKRTFTDQLDKGTQFVENVKRATTGVKTSMDTHNKQVKQRRDKEQKLASKARPTPALKSPARTEGTRGGIFNLSLDRAEQMYTIALTADEATAIDHADKVLASVGWDAPWIMVDCPEVKQLVSGKDKQFNMNLIVFKAGFEKNERYKKRGSTDARISNLSQVTRSLAVYTPPPDMHFPIEQLPSALQQMAAQWTQIVLHASSPSFMRVGTEERALGTFRAMLQAQRLVMTIPFIQAAEYMINKEYATPPLQLQTVTDFLETKLSQELLNDMITSNIHIRKAVVDEGSLLFIPMGSIVMEKCLGKKARCLSVCLSVRRIFMF